MVMLKPAPVMLAAVIDTAAFPRFDNVTPTDALVPILRFPNCRLEGLALRVPSVPVPLSGMDKELFVAVELILIFPATVPVVAGANVTEKLAVSPAVITCPALIPVALKPEPVVLS